MHIRRSKRILALMLAALLALAAVPQAVAERMTVIAKGGAKVYDAGGNALGELSADVALTLTGMKGEICRVEKDGRTAYMMKADLTAEPSATPAPQATAEPEGKSVPAFVGIDGAKVYDASGNAAGTLALNTAVTVTAVKGNICRVEKDGRTAYMKKGDLSDARVEPTATPMCETAYVRTEGAKVYAASGKLLGTLPLNTAVTVTAVKDNVSRVSGGGHTGYMRSADLSCDKTAVAASAAVGGSTLTHATGSAVEMDWWTSDIQAIFARGVVAQITDVETGLSWLEKRTGGTHHADCQPLTAADTAALKKAYGGKWSWNRRAVFVTINGVNYAASINGMPHGGGSIDDNDFNGHHCIHFTNSRTHGSNKVCPLHQAAIKKAASVTLR